MKIISIRTNPQLPLRVRVLRLALAWPMIALGIALLLNAHLGVAPYDVMNTGVSESLGVSFSVVYFAMSLVGFTVSVIGTFVIGPLISLFRDAVPEPRPIVLRSAMLIAATLLLSVAISLVISTDLGAGPVEVVMLGMIKHGMPIVAARWISDGVPLLIGIVLGGSLGVGTVVLAVAVGPLIKGILHLLCYTPSGVELIAPEVALP
jgi:uncharacterized membrane protein YczE